ncbi:gamma-glutamylcyclotransferase family protein [Chishuiella sp.]|uniref:gamma-glutamylcyclotransferase family protein n=1 Tax=Chishuiella sp. TaxID=1969467 RepID=UPI0028AE21B2|nr:gamma-glutamylcyclotransferase family protein [Chishuiella sp.]
MNLLFSYGTLQKEKVQLETFGRILEGEKDFLLNYKLDYIEIFDEEVLKKSEQKFHPILTYSGNTSDKVEGVLFEITDEELQQADEYEVDSYKRIKTIFSSGKEGFIYVEK